MLKDMAESVRRQQIERTAALRQGDAGKIPGRFKATHVLRKGTPGQVAILYSKIGPAICDAAQKKQPASDCEL
jgi:hypothetical protein